MYTLVYILYTLAYSCISFSLPSTIERLNIGFSGTKVFVTLKILSSLSEEIPVQSNSICSLIF